MASSSATVGSQVKRIVDATSRRRIFVLAVEQAGWAAIFVLSGLILLLLAGSLIFRWEWLLLLAAAGAGLAIYRIRESLMAHYSVAQILDRRLHANDTLSTAYYLLTHAGAELNGAPVYQLNQADRLAATVEPAQWFPLAGGRIWTAAAALAVIAISLFGLRYYVTESLSLRPALVALNVAPIVERIHEIIAPKKDRAEHGVLPARPDTKAETADGKEAPKDRPAAEPEVTPPPGVANASSDSAPAGKQAATDSAKTGPEGQAESKPGEAAMARQEAPKDAGSPSAPPAGEAGNKSGAQQQQTKEQQKASNQDTPPGVMSRMKDALSSMMAKMQGASSQQGKNGQQQELSDSKNSQQQASGRPQQGSQSQQQQQAQNQASNPNENAEGQAQGQTSEKQGTSQGKSSDQSAQKGSDAHSGVGQQDGDKGIKDAEQLKAMGKLAEIIGKRSAELTGDMTVETSSGKQQLKTGYSQRAGQHSNSGGEINRNQVPLAYRSYVREYMEQVRKQDKSNQ